MIYSCHNKSEIINILKSLENKLSKETFESLSYILERYNKDIKEIELFDNKSVLISLPIYVWGFGNEQKFVDINWHICPLGKMIFSMSTSIPCHLEEIIKKTDNYIDQMEKKYGKHN
jgi:hypothetical protein